MSPEGATEIPNFITLLYTYFHGAAWASVIHAWDSIIFSALSVLIVAGFFYAGTKRRKLIPSGLQNFLEMIVEFLRDLIVGIAGPEGEKYLPFLGTLFLYILTMNVLGLVPLMKSPSSNLNVTVGLAICVFCVVQYSNFKNLGFFGFLYHMAGSPKGFAGWVVAPIMFPIELMTQFARPVTLALRLSGNILGEKILVGFFALLGAGMHYFIPLQTPFLFLGLLTSIMQALVFTLLSSVYVLLSIPHEEEEMVGINNE